MSVQSQLVSFIQQQRNAGLLLENMSFYCTYSTKNENIISAGCWVLGTFWKLQKSIPSKKNQSVLITKISSCKTQKIPNAQKIKSSHNNFMLHGMLFILLNRIYVSLFIATAEIIC